MFTISRNLMKVNYRFTGRIPVLRPWVKALYGKKTAGHSVDVEKTCWGSGGILHWEDGAVGKNE
jgi:hypothetical protein